MSGVRITVERLRRVKVLFEDDHVLVVDKPAGLAVHGGADTKGRDLLEVLTAAYESPPALHLAHRLDRGTSGVLLVAKTSDVAATVQSLWPGAKKRYLAFARGVIEKAVRIEAPLSNKDGRPQAAQSDVVPVRVVGTHTLVHVDITTGRHHQIRRHLAGLGHPILMDDKYGDFDTNKAWARAIRSAGAPRPKHLALHATRLAMPHPAHGEIVTFESPMPEAWKNWLTEP